MQPAEFIAQLNHGELVAAIHAAEKLTSGEIRVFVTQKQVEDPVQAAEEQFEKLGMTATRERNGVLIFIAPESRKFAVIGDVGIHEKCGPEFWSHLAEEIKACFTQKQYTAGLAKTIEEAGRFLGKHFPRQSDDKNELPDTIGRD